MKELEYPFDASYLMTHRRQLKKTLTAQSAAFTDKRIAILGGSTTAAIGWMVELFLLNQQIRPKFYESEYNRYYEEGAFPNEKLKEFKPDIIYIHTTNRNISRYPQISDSAETVDRMLKEEFEKLKQVWENLQSTYRCPVIQNNFELPFYRLLGNKDASDLHGAVNFLTRLNIKLYEYAQTHENFYICDINYISADYGLKEWSDPFYWYMYKYAVNVDAIPFLAFNVSNIIKSVFGKNKKGFVLDLDNTLWGGVIGDEGAENIKIGSEEASGQVFWEFQRYLKAHKQLGIVLNIDSKNNKENALAGLNHPDSQLCPEDFVEIKANWEPKDRNFEEIAGNLNLLPDSLVFVDDNPAERHIIEAQPWGVSAPDMGEPHHYIRNIDRNGYFEATTISSDDQKRSQMYQRNAERANFQSGFGDYGEYLKSLEMRAVIKPFEPVYMARIAQLTNKTNQFNLTTKRYSQAEIEAIAQDPSFITLYGRLEDRFGDNGVVSVVIGRIVGMECHMDLWLMSCRVLKRDLECAMMDEVVRQCRERELRKICGYYLPTGKNGMVREFYKQQGFHMETEDPGGTVWGYDLSDSWETKNKYIQVEGMQE